MTVNNKALYTKVVLYLFITFFLTSFSGAMAMDKKFKVTVEPPSFDFNNNPPPLKDEIGMSQILGENYDKLIIEDDSPIYPPSPEGTWVYDPSTPGYMNVSMDVARKVIIDISADNLPTFYWGEVKIPITFSFWVPRGTEKKGAVMFFRDKSGINPLIALELYPYNLTDDSDDIFFRDVPLQASGIPGTDGVWDMGFYIDDLPKCSISYDFWVTIRGMESEHKPFDIEFYVDGQKITQENFEEMALKYPALKVTWAPWL